MSRRPYGQQMTDKITDLSRILERLLAENETITARAAVRNSSGIFRHASDIIRHPERRRVLADFATRQAAVRQAIKRTSKKSRQALEQELATKQQQIETLLAQRDQLIASHRAMILAVAETGGYRTWLRFFQSYDKVVRDLCSLGALPEGLGHPAARQPELEIGRPLDPARTQQSEDNSPT